MAALCFSEEPIATLTPLLARGAVQAPPPTNGYRLERPCAAIAGSRTSRGHATLGPLGWAHKLCPTMPHCFNKRSFSP